MMLEVPQHGGGCRFAEIRVFTRVLTARKMCISSNAFFRRYTLLQNEE